MRNVPRCPASDRHRCPSRSLPGSLLERSETVNRPLRIAYLIPALGVAGMEGVVVNLCNHLDPNNFQPMICTFEDGRELERAVNADRVELLSLRRRFGNDPRIPLRLAGWLRERKIDILQTNSWGPLVEGFLAARLARVPILVHAEYGTIESRWRNRCVQRFLWRAFDRVVAICQPLARSLAETIRFPCDRIQVIPAGVDTERLRPSHVDKRDLRRDLGLPPDGLLLGMIARFVPLKDHDGVIRAVARLREAGWDVRLALVGEGLLRGALEESAHALGVADRVHFMGLIPRVEPLLNALDMLISNSHREGMSITILEGMACGLPVVATKVGAAAELLADGAAGVLFPPQDTTALVTAISDLAQQPARRRLLGQAARQRAEAVFSITAMVDGYTRMYHELWNSRYMQGTRPVNRRATRPG